MNGHQVIDEVSLRTVRATDRSTWLFVTVSCGGHTGVGEMSDLDPLSAAGGLFGVLAERIRGIPVAAAETWLGTDGPRWANRPTTEAGRLRRRTALGGVATAVADLAARTADVTLAQWLGGQPGVKAIPLYANINRAMRERTPEAAARLATHARAAGFRAVKCAPFDGLTGENRAQAGLEIATAVRDAIGAEVGLMVDVHHELDLPQLLMVADGLAGLRLDWLEDAVPIGDVDGLWRVRDAVGCPLAGGEFVGDPGDLRPALHAGVLDVVMPDVKHAGGPSAVLALARVAVDHGARVSLHNPSGPVATAASGHVAALLPPDLPLESMFGEHAARSAFAHPLEHIEHGELHLPPGPGLALRLMPAALEKEVRDGTHIA